MKKFMITLYIGTHFLYTAYCVDYDYIFTTPESVTPQALNANFDTVRYLQNKSNKEIEKCIKEGDYRLRWNQRGAINAENITTQDGFEGSANNLQDVLSNQIVRINAIATIVSTNTENFAQSWSSYPATQNVNINNFSLLNIDSITVINAYGNIRSSDIYCNNIIGNGFIDIGSVTASGNINATTFSGNGANVDSVDADQLDGQEGSYYLDVDNMNAGILDIARGGTNNNTFDSWGFLTYDGSKILSTFSVVSVATSGHTHLLNDLVGTVAINKGGTNNTSYDTNSLLYYDGTRISSMAFATYTYSINTLALTNNFQLNGNTTGDLTQWENISCGTLNANTINCTGSTNINADKLDGYHATFFLSTATAFSGDVTGEYDSTVVGDNSHNHDDTTVADDLTISSTKKITTTNQLESTIATGTSPLSVNSTTKVTNLNSDRIDDYHIKIGKSDSDATGYCAVDFGGLFSSTVTFVCSLAQNDTNHTIGATFSVSSATVTTWTNANNRAGPIGFSWIAIGN